MDFRIMRLRDLASQHVAHWTLLVWHKTAIWVVQLERAAEPFVCVPKFRFATPQFRCAVVVIPDHTCNITTIDGDGGQIEQGAVAFFVFPQRILGSLVVDDGWCAVMSRERVAGQHGFVAQGTDWESRHSRHSRSPGTKFIKLHKRPTPGTGHGGGMCNAT